MPVSIPSDSFTAKTQRRVQRIAKLYNLDELDVSINPLNDCIDVRAVKGDKIYHAQINQGIVDWRSVEHVVSAMFDKTEII